MAHVTLYGAADLERFEWPDTEEGRLAQNYLLPLIQEGPDTFISNAKTTLYLLTVDDFIVPISVNDAEYDNSYLLSSYFVAANLKEKVSRASRLSRTWRTPIAATFGQLLKWMKINKVVIVNNWLLTTNPYPELSQEQIQAVTAFLSTRFPEHYLMFRSINTYQSSHVFDRLSHTNYRMIPSRNVYLYDPNKTKTLPPSTLRKQKKDLSKLARSDYHVETVQSLSDHELSRILELYEHVYIGRYTKYSPRYTKKYLQSALENHILHLKLLKKGDQIDGVTGFLKKNGLLLTSFFGYDTTIPQKVGLYRMLSGMIMEQIEKENLISHQGSGGADFKKWRGYIEQQEYVAIYDTHLPLSRRLFWSLGEKFSSKTM